MGVNWFDWFLLISVCFAGTLVPGPAFILTIKNSLLYSRKVGIFTVIGLSLAMLFHVTYSFIGIAAMIAQSLVLFNILKYLGAAYLFYIGIKSLISKNHLKKINVEEYKSDLQVSASKAFFEGFITNALNPKAAIFFLAIFSQFIDPKSEIMSQILYGITPVIIEFLWFSFVALVLTTPHIKLLFLGLTEWISRICGVLFITLSIKLAFSRIE